MQKNSSTQQSKATDTFIKSGPDAMSSHGLVKSQETIVHSQKEGASPLEEGQQTASDIAPKKHEYADDALQPGQSDVIKSAVCSKAEDNQPGDLERGMHKQIDQQKIDEDLLDY